MNGRWSSQKFKYQHRYHLEGYNYYNRSGWEDSCCIWYYKRNSCEDFAIQKICWKALNCKVGLVETNNIFTMGISTMFKCSPFDWFWIIIFLRFYLRSHYRKNDNCNIFGFIGFLMRMISQIRVSILRLAFEWDYVPTLLIGFEL